MGMAREKDADDVEVVEEETGPRSFAVFVDQLADGALNLDASVELHRLGQALMARVNAGERKAKGELDVKLKIEWRIARRTRAVRRAADGSCGSARRIARSRRRRWTRGSSSARASGSGGRGTR